MFKTQINKVFWEAALKRAAWTAAQSAAAALIAFMASAQFLHEVNWFLALSVAGLAAVLSVLKSVAFTPEEVVLKETAGAVSRPQPSGGKNGSRYFK
ncbi:MAG: holin [Coriobacteriia bacterium]|nr:holin [Coriobacteriia bacterium]